MLAQLKKKDTFSQRIFTLRRNVESPELWKFRAVDGTPSYGKCRSLEFPALLPEVFRAIPLHYGISRAPWDAFQVVHLRSGNSMPQCQGVTSCPGALRDFHSDPSSQCNAALVPSWIFHSEMERQRTNKRAASGISDRGRFHPTDPGMQVWCGNSEVMGIP